LPLFRYKMNKKKCNDENLRTIREYNRFRKDAERIQATTIENQEYHLKGLSESISKSFKDATEKDILEFLDKYAETTRDGIIATLRKFYQWLFELERGDKLPKCIRNIRPTPKRLRDKNEIKYRERYITEEEYQKLIDHALNPMHKAMIETLYKFGVRVSELLSMKSDKVSYDGEFTRITVFRSKTKPRDAVHKGRLTNLMTYVESYQPFRGKKGEPLWVGRNNNCFSKRGMQNMLGRVSKYSELGRYVNNHDFRHSSITNDLKNGIPTTHVETKHGLVHGSLVISRYDHNKTKQFEEWLKDNRKPVEDETYVALKQKKDTMEKGLKTDMEHMKQVYENVIGKLKADMHKLKNQFDDFENNVLDERKREKRQEQMNKEEEAMSPEEKAEQLKIDVRSHKRAIEFDNKEREKEAAKTPEQKAEEKKKIDKQWKKLKESMQ